jgi:hypothetical protein
MQNGPLIDTARKILSSNQELQEKINTETFIIAFREFMNKHNGKQIAHNSNGDIMIWSTDNFNIRVEKK